MVTDLFTKREPARIRLYKWMCQKKWAKTSEIIYIWGKENFTTRADRYARDLASEGKIRRMPQEKKLRLFGPIKEDVWEIITWTEMPVTQR